MTILVMSSLPDANPSGAPAGWTAAVSSRPARILTGGFGRSSSAVTGDMAIWLDNVQYPGNTLSAKFTHASNATLAGNDSCRVTFLNADRNGYALWLNQAGTTVKVFRVNVCVQGTEIASFTGYGTGYAQNFELRCIDKTTGTFQVLYNNVQIGTNIVDTTYTNLVSIGAAANGGYLRNIQTGGVYDISSITNPVVIGSSISAVLTGYSTITSITAAGISATDIVFNAGTGVVTATWPNPVNDQVYPFLPTSTIGFTFSDGTNPIVAQSQIVLRPDMDYVTFGENFELDNPFYLGTIMDIAGIAIEEGDRCYYSTTGNLIIFPDGRIQIDVDAVPYSEDIIIHKISDQKTFYHTLQVTEQGTLIDLSDWTIQSESPIFDGLYHHSNRP